MSPIVRQSLECGLTLIVEHLENVASTAVSLLLPVGSAGDPEESQGESALLAEMIFRGAGGLSSREHSDALDRLGVLRGARAQTHHLYVEATMLSRHLADTLSLVISMVREPALPGDAIDPVRSLCLQSLDAIKDDPQHAVMLDLRRQHQPAPFNRHGYGERAALESISIDQLRTAWADRCRPEGSILTIAGDADADAVAGQLDSLLAGWEGACPEARVTAEPTRGVHHTAEETAQVHLGIAYDAPREADPDSMIERLGVTVLAGGMSSRLFTEVRERRSLCYSVGGRYAAGRDRGHVGVSSGTTQERAQETLEVCIAEIRRLREGASEEEFQRAVVGTKSRLVMQGESTDARAAALAADEYRIGRPRTLAEVADAVDAVTLDDLNAYLARREFGEFTFASIGPAALTRPE